MVQRRLTEGRRLSIVRATENHKPMEMMVMSGFKSVFSSICAVALLSACQKPMVFTPEMIKPYPLSQGTPAPVAAQPVSASPAYVLESAPVIETQAAPAYVIESQAAGAATVQPVAETVTIAEPAYVLESEPMMLDAEPMAAEAAPMILDAEPMAAEAASMMQDAGSMAVDVTPMSVEVEPVMIPAEPMMSEIPAPVVESEVEILSAPVLESSAAPVLEATTIETVAEPVVESMAADAMQDFSTFSDAGAVAAESVSAVAGTDGVMPAMSAPVTIEAAPLAPLGVQQPGVAAYGQPL